MKEKRKKLSFLSGLCLLSEVYKWPFIIIIIFQIYILKWHSQLLLFHCLFVEVGTLEQTLKNGLSGSIWLPINCHFKYNNLTLNHFSHKCGENFHKRAWFGRVRGRVASGSWMRGRRGSDGGARRRPFTISGAVGERELGARISPAPARTIPSADRTARLFPHHWRRASRRWRRLRMSNHRHWLPFKGFKSKIRLLKISYLNYIRVDFGKNY